jgi:hypothetical protein
MVALADTINFGICVICKSKGKVVGTGVFMAVTMKNAVFWVFWDVEICKLTRRHIPEDGNLQR